MRRAYKTLVARTLIINTKSDKAFRGVLWGEARDYLILRNAVLIAGQETPIDGELLVERANIDFIQIVNPEA